MIAVNGTPVDFTQFPDGTTSFRFDPDSEDWYNASTAMTETMSASCCGIW